MHYYHITRRRNMASIMMRGILPSGKTGISGISRDMFDKVFLTNDPKRILVEHCGKRWVDKEDTVVLVVEPRPETVVVPHRYTAFKTPIDSTFEFVADHIYPSEIKATLDVSGITT